MCRRGRHHLPFEHERAEALPLHEYWPPAAARLVIVLIFVNLKSVFLHVGALLSITLAQWCTRQSILSTGTLAASISCSTPEVEVFHRKS